MLAAFVFDPPPRKHASPSWCDPLVVFARPVAGGDVTKVGHNCAAVLYEIFEVGAGGLQADA